MAQRRMFSKTITNSDMFLNLPVSTRDLYFFLGMNADDDGFVQLRATMRMVGASEEDAKLLLNKNLILVFESGVVVVRDWLIHNEIRQDRYKETFYIEEKKLLKLNDNKQYVNDFSLVLPNDNHLDTQVRLGKDRLGKDSIKRENAHPIKEIKYSSITEITEDVFKEISERYNVPPDFVVDCWDSALNWLESKGTTKKNYKAFLSNWVKKERLNISVHQKRGGTIDARL